MGIIKISDKMMAKFGDVIFNHLQSSWVERFVAYVIDSKYRKSVTLKNWLKEQIDTISDEMYAYASKIPESKSMDAQMDYISEFVAKNLQYIRDTEKWGMNEKWQTGDETILANTGDCEDGAILTYILARIKGIPANRLMLFTGWVQSSPTAPKGGHCWLGYKPNNYPSSFKFIDWCYYYDSRPMSLKPYYIVEGKEIRKWTPDFYPTSSKYISIWNGFNENLSVTKIER